MTEHEKKEFNKIDTADDTGPPNKRLRYSYAEPLVRTSGWFTVILYAQHTCIFSIRPEKA